MPATETLPVAALISGGGTTLRNLIQQINAGQLPIDIRLVVSSHPEAGGLRIAREAGIPSCVLERASFTSATDYGAAVFAACRERQVALVVMGGFLKFVPIPQDFSGRVINIHPSLIPAFCGHGYYGHHVHEAVLEYGVRFSGCTVHFVDNQYDHGPVILQRVVPVHDDDTPQSLAQRVFAEECWALPEAIRLFAAGRLQCHGRRVVISP